MPVFVRSRYQRSPRYRAWLPAARPLATAAITGTAEPSETEVEVVTGGETTIITLTHDTWVAAGATFNAERQNIINGCDSAQSELLGWDNVVKALQGVAGVVRTSDTVVTITWDAFATYQITANETITVTVPATAVARATSMVGTPTFGVIATGAAAVGGPLVSSGHLMGRVLVGGRLAA